jgi:hypothetical protein
MNKKAQARFESLLPKGIPRYVRCYDNGESGDRYTVVFSKKSVTQNRPHYFMYLGMSGAPFHPQGVCQHGETPHWPCDAKNGKWPPAIGRKNHLGKRIAFADLPADCQKAVLNDYKDLWNIA